MSKKRAKSKRRRESQRPASATKEPRLVLITNTSNVPDVASGVRAVNSNVEPSLDPEERGEPAEAREESRARSEVRVAEERPSDPPESKDDLDEEERFFHEGRIQTPQAFAVTEEIEVEPPKPSPKMTPVARARRAHFSKYVKGAMVAASAILVLAGIRLATGHHAPDAKVAATLEAPRPVEISQAMAAPVVPQKATEPMAAAPSKLDEIPPPPEPAAEPAKAEVAKTEEVAKAEVAKAEPAKAEPAKVEAKAEAKAEPAKVEAGGKTALEEKNAARTMLERGKAAAAIEAGERSVALDPADGEAWLILGAAYQEKGNLKDARRAFQSCLKDAKRGPKAECKAMLQ